MKRCAVSDRGTLPDAGWMLDPTRIFDSKTLKELCYLSAGDDLLDDQVKVGFTLVVEHLRDQFQVRQLLQRYL